MTGGIRQNHEPHWERKLADINLGRESKHHTHETGEEEEKKVP